MATKKELEKQAKDLQEGPTRLIRIDRSDFTLTLFGRAPEGREWTEMKVYGIAIGMDGYFKGVDRPYLIHAKAEDPDWRKPYAEWVPKQDQGEIVEGGTPDNPLGTRWMSIDQNGHGIHGTNAPWTIGTASSHGCFRMKNEDVEDLYERVDCGTPVVIRR